MKVCPSCRTQYTDDSLAFCLQDGTPLINADTGPATIGLGETETVVKGRTSETTQWHQGRETNISPVPDRKRSNWPLFAAILILLLIIFVGGGVAVLYFFLRPSGDTTNKSLATTPTPANSITTNSNTTRPAPFPTANTNVNTPSPTPVAVDVGASRREIADRVTGWKEATESLNVNSLMSYYADTVDYYRRGPTSAGFVRGDKQRAFSRFNSISITISKLDVSVDPAGNAATAVFDKQWVFEGDHTSTGKVRSQLKFNKTDGKWLITGERDLGVYKVD